MNVRVLGTGSWGTALAQVLADNGHDVIMWGISPALTIPVAAFIPIIIGYSTFFHTRIRKTFLVADEEEGKLSSITG